MTDVYQFRAQSIRRSCFTIATLWRPATLIAYRLAQPDRSESDGGHSKYPKPHPPIDDTDVMELHDMMQWLLDAATQLGMSRSVAYDSVHKDTEDLAIWIGQRAGDLASLPDGRDWTEDAVSYANNLRDICHDHKPDPRTWRARTVVWQPTIIADMLTTLTGHVVRAGQIRLLAHRGKITVTGGTVTLGDVADGL